MADGSGTITVKLFGKRPIQDVAPFLRHFPGGEPIWGRCRFVFKHEHQDYDWAVVYDDLPGPLRLQCPRQNTLLVTTEPASIKVYGRAYTRQFGHVLTSQEPYAVDHPSVIRHQPALMWYFGVPFDQTQHKPRTYDQMMDGPPPIKDADLSTVCSNKAMGHTLHRLRYEFVQLIKTRLPELDVYGRGERPINDKAEAMDRYRYHLAIENHLAPHHITEKLTDTFLAQSLPFYFGAPNAEDYFPPESFIPIDIRNTEEAIAAVRKAIDDNEYERRLPAILEAKRRTMQEQNLFAVLSKQIERLDIGERGAGGAKVFNRRSLRSRNPLGAVRYLIERYRVQDRLKRESMS